MEKFSGKKLVEISPKVTIASALLISIYINVIFVVGSSDDLYDFGSFIASGQLANTGQNPYSAESSLILQVEFSKINRSGISPNLNPPISVMLFQIIGDANPRKSVMIWRILTVILYLFSI